MKPKIGNLQRTISASSFESNTSITLETKNNLNFTPTLSASGNLEQMYSYSINSPDVSPLCTPKASKSFDSVCTDQESKQQCFGTERDRTESLEAIHAALSEVQTKRSKSFNAYKHGLGTYSNGNNSGCNTTGTATPNSCGSLLEGIEGSEYSFEADMNDLESERSDKEETPVPTPCNDATQSIEMPIFDRNGFGLAQISEDAETNSNDEQNSANLRTEESDDDDDDNDDGEEDIFYGNSFEDEIILKGSRFESSRILFLDVDGVLLSSSEQQHLGKGANIKFNDDVTALMIKLCRETDCDIVISSTWQFYAESHLKWLCFYLVACGWKRSKIHTLLDLLPSVPSEDGVIYGREWYEESPYCRCRARGIQKIVSMYAAYITSWCALDDLPLHSGKSVCIPRKEDLNDMVRDLSEAYFKAFEWRQHQKEELMPNIYKCVEYAITKLSNCIFGSNSYRFGYEYDQTMIFYQADAIFKSCTLSYDIKDNAALYQVVIQSMMAVISQYIGANLTFQGDPYIAPYLIQTNQKTGITPQNIENAITLLTYRQNNRDHQNMNDTV